MNGNRPEPDDRPGPRTRIAILGTLGSLHGEALRHNLDRLRSLVQSLEPDLLGIETEQAAWEAGDPSLLPVEICDGLVRGTRLTDTIVIPLGGASPLELAPPLDGHLAGLRAGLIRAADQLLAVVGRTVDDPGRVSRGAYIHVCAAICHLQAEAASDAGRRAWQARNERILDRLLEAIRRDPGRRVLVAIQCRRIHWLETRLAVLPDVELVPFECLTQVDRRATVNPRLTP